MDVRNYIGDLDDVSCLGHRRVLKLIVAAPIMFSSWLSINPEVKV